jgi:hypothetical protein
MQSCKTCGSENREGVCFCEYCGQGFPRLQQTLFPPRPQDADEIHFAFGNGLIFHVKHAPDLVIHPHDTQVIGRADETTPQKPAIDLSAYQACEKGVSRRHAALHWSEDRLALTDLGSTNGTYINHRRLSANQPHLLRDGDEIRFGNLHVRVEFIREEVSTPRLSASVGY